MIPSLAVAVLLAESFPPLDFIGLTFDATAVAMLTAAAFFLRASRRTERRWQPMMLVAGIIPLIAGINYVSMARVWAATYDPVSGQGQTPTPIRYFDWLLTVPLLCSQFYLLLRGGLPAGRVPRALFWRLAGAGLFMLACGYVGERWQTPNNMLWGTLATLGWLVVLWEVLAGSARQLLQRSDDLALKRTFDLLCTFVTVGWGIYPIGYMTLPGNLLEGLNVNLNVIYNVGDALNKIGFAFVLWTLASPTRHLRP